MIGYFNSDLMLSERYARFLDQYFYEYLKGAPKGCPFFSVNDYQHVKNEPSHEQYAGIDVIFNHSIPLDEKTALDHRRRSAPLRTFAFELGYMIDGKYSEGWVTSAHKITEYYVLSWPHDASEMGAVPDFDLAEVMIIRRKDVLDAIQQYFAQDIEGIRTCAREIVYEGKDAEHGLIIEPPSLLYGGTVQRKERWRKELCPGVHLIHSTGAKKETPLNVVIAKSKLAEMAGFVFWVDPKREGRSPVVRIPAAKYHSPKSWTSMASFMERP